MNQSAVEKNTNFFSKFNFRLGKFNSISKKISFIIAASLILFLGISLAILIKKSSQRELANAYENLAELKQIMMKSIEFSMGEGITDLSPYTEMLRKMPRIREIRVIPGDRITEGSSGKMDATELTVYKSGTGREISETFEQEPVIRIIEPVLATPGCLNCHQGKNGEPLAVVSLRYSMASTMASIRSQKWLGTFLGLAMVLFMFLTIYYLIKREIIYDLKRLIQFAQKLSHGNIRDTITTKRDDELGEAVRALQTIQNSIKEKTYVANQIAQGNLDVDINIISEMDDLGEAMATLRENLLDVIQAMKKMQQEQKIGNMDAFIPAEQFYGVYQQVASGINEAVQLHIENIQLILDTLNAYANGDFSQKMKRLPGKQATLNDRVDRIKTNLENMIEEIVTLTRAAQSGNLQIRGDVQKFKGGYRDIIEGINKTLDAVIEPFIDVQNVLEEMSRGNFKIRMEKEYQGDFAKISTAVNHTLDALNDILGKVYVAVNQVASGAQQVSDTSQVVSQGATEQASSLEEIASSITQINSQSRQNAENAAQADELTVSARNAAESGDEQMKRMLDAMNEINNSSMHISKIIKVIDEIAFQTNLLALNAAVEAARAGAHGKGFAVVADEVRNLAQRSAKAAKETTELIEGSIEKVKNGTRIANQTAEALKEIIEGIARVTDLVGEISVASKEQVLGIDQVNQALEQIDMVTQSNAASAEESASAAQELSGQAMQLKQMLNQFQLDYVHNENPGIREQTNSTNRSSRKNDSDIPWGGSTPIIPNEQKAEFEETVKVDEEEP